jgi:hypothetical protein
MSITSFVTTLAGLTVTGVTRKYTYPPLQIGTADLPASFVRPPQSDYEPIATCEDVNETAVCQLVVAIEPTGQNLQPTNYAAMLAMVDAVNDTLRTNQFSLGALVSWTIAAQDREPVIVGGTPYWGVTATVTKRG